MTDNERKRSMKVSRQRRRLYDDLPEAPDATPSPAPSPVPSDPAALPAPEPSAETVSANFARETVVKPYARMMMASALIPIPLVDLVGGAAVQLKMIRKLAELYRVEFSEQRTRAIIGSLIGGFHVGLFTGSLLKFAPVIGLATGLATSALISYGITYALGMLFIRHFASGGTLLDFDMQKARREFPEAYIHGRKEAASLRRDHSS